MNIELLKLWNSINDAHFEGELRAIADIDWHTLTGEEGLDAFGIYLDKANSIAIDERFKFDTDRCEAKDEAELAKVEVAYRLVLHEMIHQSLHQKRIKYFGKHGAEFMAEATPIAEKLGIDPPTTQNAFRWPDLLPILAHHNI